MSYVEVLARRGEYATVREVDARHNALKVERAGQSTMEYDPGSTPRGRVGELWATRQDLPSGRRHFFASGCQFLDECFMDPTMVT